MANVVIEEQAHITIRSDKRHDPSSPSYNMGILPATYEETMQRPDSDQWLETMKAELQTMKEMCVYKLTKLPEGRKAIGCRWVLEFKEDNKGRSVFKARLVTQGFSQVPGVNYGATFTPVIKPASVRLIVILACQKNWEMDTFDTKRVFLWGILKEEIYMCQYKGFKDSDWHTFIWLMLHTIYRLKQSALKWYKQVCSIMADLGFIRTESDHMLFYYKEVESAVNKVRTQCLIEWHVDDGMAASNSRPFLTMVKKKITERFGIKDLGPVTKYLGVQLKRDQEKCKIWMHQTKYIAFLLQEYGLMACSPVCLPADPQAPLGSPSEQFPDIPDLHAAYLKMIGELIYLSINTCPDISYIVNALAQYNTNPEPRHFATAKHILQYLAGTNNLCLQYEYDEND